MRRTGYLNRLQHVAQAAPARVAPAPVPEGKVLCPACSKAVKYRAEGKLASTLVAHRNSGIPCRMGTPASVAIDPVIVDLAALLGNQSNA